MNDFYVTAPSSPPKVQVKKILFNTNYHYSKKVKKKKISLVKKTHNLFDKLGKIKIKNRKKTVITDLIDNGTIPNEIYCRIDSL